MSPVSQQPTREVVSTELPTALLAQLDEIANRGAHSARAGHSFRVFTLLALPEKTDFRSEDLALMAYAAELGWREGLEVRQ